VPSADDSEQGISPTQLDLKIASLPQDAEAHQIMRDVIQCVHTYPSRVSPSVLDSWRRACEYMHEPTHRVNGEHCVLNAMGLRKLDGSEPSSFVSFGSLIDDGLPRSNRAERSCDP